MANDLPRFDLTGDVALVTGAARGLGRAISLARAHAGADVVLGLRDGKTGGELAREIEATGRRTLPLQMDMTRLDQISRAVDDIVAHFGRLDILVNNAGLSPENLAENVREEDFDLTLKVNLKGTFFASQAAGRMMIRQKRGCIVNTSGVFYLREILVDNHEDPQATTTSETTTKTDDQNACTRNP